MKVLLISPVFYGFDAEIKEQLKKLGHEVYFYPEKIEFKFKLFQLLIQKLPSIYYMWIFGKYVNKIINKEIDPDLIILIRGEFWGRENLSKLKRAYCKAKFIMYQWDSSNNLPLLREQLDLFDNIYTFDDKDSAELKIGKKNLFFKMSWLVNKVGGVGSECFKYKISFVGTDHSDRLQVLSDFVRVNSINKSDFYFHLYRSKYSYYYNKFILRNPLFINQGYKGKYKNKPLSEDGMKNVFSNSCAILDINPDYQVGLSARTFEAIAFKKKLITTNRNIEKYDFFNPSNIFVIDKKNPVVDKSFFEKPYEEVPLEIIDKYSSFHWVQEIIENGENNC